MHQREAGVAVARVDEAVGETKVGRAETRVGPPSDGEPPSARPRTRTLRSSRRPVPGAENAHAQAMVTGRGLSKSTRTPEEPFAGYGARAWCESRW